MVRSGYTGLRLKLSSTNVGGLTNSTQQDRETSEAAMINDRILLEDHKPIAYIEWTRVGKMACTSEIQGDCGIVEKGHSGLYRYHGEAAQQGGCGNTI